MPEAWLAGPQAWLNGPQAWMAGPQTWLAGSHAWLDGPEGVDVRMGEKFPHLQEFISYPGRYPKRMEKEFRN